MNKKVETGRQLELKAVVLRSISVDLEDVADILTGFMQVLDKS